MLKARYRKNVTLESWTTRFGLTETNHPQLYDSPINDKFIYKVDTFQCLKGTLGNYITDKRRALYTVVSGNGTDEDYRKDITYLYKRFSSFANYVDLQWYFGDPEKSFVLRIVEPMHSLIKEFSKEVDTALTKEGGTFLMSSNGYLYYCFNDTIKLEDVEVTVIC